MSGFIDGIRKTCAGCRAGYKRWGVFMDRQGFYVMLGVCIAVIVGTAVWTRSAAPPAVPPPTLSEDAQAGSEAEFVQRLSDVNWGAPPSGDAMGTADVTQMSPALDAGAQGALDTPVLSWPLQGEVLRGHSIEAPVFLPTMGEWAIHDGIDIAAKTGDPVGAALSGTVGAAYADPMRGNVIEVRHPGGFVTRYMGLATLNLLRVGDPVKTGQLLSPLGPPMALEAEDPAHLHFELLRDGEWVDPEEYLEQQR